VSEQGAREIGALASTLAAEMYGLEVSVSGIETNRKNYTRFIILDHFMDAPTGTGFDKVSVSFAVSHEAGSLYMALKGLAENNANMTKIQSAPIPGRPWEYLFFVDFLIEDHEQFGPIITGLSTTTKGLKILGKYKEGKHYEL
jgi:prephenate dehydratase